MVWYPRSLHEPSHLPSRIRSAVDLTTNCQFRQETQHVMARLGRQVRLLWVVSNAVTAPSVIGLNVPQGLPLYPARACS
jgi:hypothetical protein